MRGYVLLVALAVAASAAPRSHVVPSSDLTKKLTEVVKEALKEPPVVDNPSENELDQVNSATEVENNNLRKGDKVKGIPVAVIPDVNPVETVKVKDTFGIVKGNDEVVEEIKRAEVDLKHPGEPQRQEHDTQSPEEINQEQESINVFKQGIVDSQIALKQGIEGIAQEFSNFVASNEQLSIIKKSIQTIHDNFNKQLANLNQTISESFNGGPSTEKLAEESVVKEEEAGDQSLLKSVASVKQDSPDSGSSGSTDQPSGSNTWVTQIQSSLSQFQTLVNQGFSNMTAFFQNNNNFNNASGSIFENFGQGPQTNLESDETQTNRPGIWTNLQNTFQNIWRPGQSENGGNDAVQSDQPAPAPAAPGPFVQAIQNNPLVQGFQNLLNRPQGNSNKPSVPVKPAETSAQEGSNAVPQQPQESSAEQKPSQPAAAGPIQQIVQRNPIVQGIAGAVQRIQSTVVNPEKPRQRAGLDFGGRKGGNYGSAAVGK